MLFQMAFIVCFVIFYFTSKVFQLENFFNWSTSPLKIATLKRHINNVTPDSMRPRQIRVIPEKMSGVIIFSMNIMILGNLNEANTFPLFPQYKCGLKKRVKRPLSAFKAWSLHRTKNDGFVNSLRPAPIVQTLRNFLFALPKHLLEVFKPWPAFTTTFKVASIGCKRGSADKSAVCVPPVIQF